MRATTDRSIVSGRTVSVFAPAKINLTLHVTGQRSDGYHLLDSLVAFADVGDTLRLSIGSGPGFTVDGPEAAAVPTGADNLVLRAARLLAAEDVTFHLEKSLPVASGIGGGSADAAAALRALWRVEGEPRSWQMLDDLLQLGADLPVCLAAQACRMQGIGEQLTPLEDLPQLHAVLANPRVAVSTPAVFRALGRKENPAMPGPLPAFAGPAHLVTWLAEQRNDLEAPAMHLEPAVRRTLDALAGLPGCRLARMSGSGATCFALFDDAKAAGSAARALAADHPRWWIRPARLGTMSELARPVLS